jgi:hypothetical protein
MPKAMAKRARQPKLRCQIHFMPDRHVLQKLSQVYHWLVPESAAGPQSTPLAAAGHEKDSRHLRSSLL